MEMGFIPGETVFVQRYAPLKDPIEFVIKHYHVSLRREDSSFVEVTLPPRRLSLKSEPASEGGSHGGRHRWRKKSP